jgi:hypothetical protein
VELQRASQPSALRLKRVRFLMHIFGHVYVDIQWDFGLMTLTTFGASAVALHAGSDRRLQANNKEAKRQ